MPRKLLLIILLIALFILSSSFIHAQQRERLATPTNLKFSDGVLTWDPVPNAHRYHIRWRTGNSNWQSARISRFRAGYRFTRLPLNVTVTMRVRALAGASDDYRHSLWSDDRDVVLTVAASATPTATDTATPSPTPTATNTATPSPMATEAVLKDLPRPSGLRHISDSTVVWDAVEGATAYHLRWRQSGGRRRNKVIAETQTRYTIPDLAPGIEYEVKVRALGDGRRYERAGEWSGVVQLTLEAEATNTPTNAPTATPTNTPTATNTSTSTPTDMPDLPMLPAPSNLRLISGSTVAWDAVVNAVEYRLRWTAPNGEQSFAKTGLSPNPQFIIQGLLPELTYQVHVQALGDNMTYRRRGAWSDALTLTLEAAASPTSIPSETPTNAPTNTPVPTDTPTDTPTNTPTDTPTNTPTDTPTNTPTDTPTNTPTDTPTNTPTDTPTNTPTDTPTNTPTDTPTNTPTDTPTNTPTNTPTDTPTNTPTDTPTNTPTDTPTNTPTDTPTNTPTDTPTNTPTDTPTNTPVPPTNTPTDTPTDTPTSTPPPHLPYPRNLRHSLFTVSWDPVPGAVEYGIHVRASVGDQPIRYVSGTSYDIPNPRIGASYFILVQSRGDGRAYAVDNDWSPRYGFSIQPTATPVPPTNTPLPTDTPVPPTATPVPTDTPVPTNTPVPPTATPVPTETPSPVPTPGPVRSLKSAGVLTDAFGVEWKPPLVGVSRKTTYRVEYMDPWSDSWSLAGTTDRLSYYKNEAGWSGEFGIRVRAEGKNGVGPWSRISASVA